MATRPLGGMNPFIGPCLPIDTIDLDALKDIGLVHREALGAKVFLKGELAKKVVLVGIGATKGARAAIEAAGGSFTAGVARNPIKNSKEAKAAAKA